jgi:hypothetical protein
MKVKNLNAAVSRTEESVSWLSHWEKLSGLNAFMCYAKGCINRPSVGGHVQKDSPTDTNWYVIPLCDECSRRRGQDLDIWDAATLISSRAASASGGAAYFAVACGSRRRNSFLTTS